MQAERCLCLKFFITAVWIIWLKVMVLHVFIKTLFSASDPNNHDIWHVHSISNVQKSEPCKSCLAVLVSAGVELIFLPVAAVFWISYEKNLDNGKGRQDKKHMWIVLKWRDVTLLTSNESVVIISQLQLTSPLFALTQLFISTSYVPSSQAVQLPAGPCKFKWQAPNGFHFGTR